MPRLTSNERTGLLLAAVAATATIAGLLLIERHGKSTPLPPQKAETIYIERPDTAATGHTRQKSRRKKPQPPATPTPRERSPLDEPI